MNAQIDISTVPELSDLMLPNFEHTAKSHSAATACGAAAINKCMVESIGAGQVTAGVSEEGAAVTASTIQRVNELGA